MGSGLVAIDQGFMGPNYSISTACATANYAYHAACMHIRNGEADVMLAGGSEAPIIPVGLGGFVACRCVPSWTLDASVLSAAAVCGCLPCLHQLTQRCGPESSLQACCGWRRCLLPAVSNDGSLRRATHAYPSSCHNGFTCAMVLAAAG